MNKRIFYCFLMSAVTLVSFSQKRKVLVLGIDGCRADALMAAYTPNIDKLLKNATFSMDAINDGITSSGPSWSSILTGVGYAKHGVINNSFDGKKFEEYPHFFKYLEDLNSDYHTVSISQWWPINEHIASEYADRTINVLTEWALIWRSELYLKYKDPDAVFIQFNDVDHAGHKHSYGSESEEYIEEIEEVDKGIGRIMAALESRSHYSKENWLIIVTTDHGGIGKGHGGNSIEERNVFLICSGKNTPSHEIKKEGTLITQNPPENCLSDSVELYFNGRSKVVTPLNDIYNFSTKQDFTIECRVRTKNAGDVAIIADKDWKKGSNKGFVFSFTSGQNPSWKVNVGDGSERIDVSGNVIHDNQWHTLSATFDRDGLLTIYEDGHEVKSASLETIDDVYSGLPIVFGADANDDYQFSGHIAEVRVFNKVISKENIEKWACRKIDELHPDKSSLVGYWRLTDGGESIIAKDSSPTKAHGEIQNAKWKNTTKPVQVWEYDYSMTPRLEDVAVTALSHMGVPIKAEWKLDGESLLANDSKLFVQPTSLVKEQVQVNVLNQHIRIKSSSQEDLDKVLVIYNIFGGKVVNERFTANFQYNFSHFESGVYVYQILSRDQLVKNGKFSVKR